MKLHNTDAAIDAAIESILKRGKSLQNDIHKASCSILRQWFDSGNVATAVRQTNKLVGAMPDMARSNALKAWFESFAGFVWNKDEKHFVYRPDATKIAEERVKAAIAEPFWAFSPEPDYKPMNIDAMIEAIVKKARQRRQKGLKEGVDYVPEEKLKALEALLPSGK